MSKPRMAMPLRGRASDWGPRYSGYGHSRTPGEQFMGDRLRMPELTGDTIAERIEEARGAMRAKGLEMTRS